MSDTTMVAIDDTDALAFVIVRPAEGGVSIEAAAKGLSKEDAARILRHVASLWEAEASQ
ncbi:hypothetical protein RM863_12655 [Streptomyces sp. DSM 41014]|uniref:Uncharacterized protein n=1 Tax=Streptomyces hintoniae TaxID=3075521 RepID=A0ABU2UIQ2_9ACTN|nr:hypothetical protein [Streptomyces sp. DSM 41014]MDT0472974.1 hypothetical protein [Streptomyces sp. DSM 41014]